MAHGLAASIIILALFYVPAFGGRTSLFSEKVQVQAGETALVSTAGDDDGGICKSMVQTQNYVCEEHKVITQDGYVLSLQRIPVGQSGEKTAGNGPPVLLQHGLLMDAITWLLLPPNQSLAFALADNGFDVWLANTRGTKYSLGHTSLTPQDPAYWYWSWDELVAYDLPSTFQYVHDQTGQKLHYVGHSLGTLTALAAISKDQLVSMLRSAALLCPIAYVGNVTSPLAKNAADNFIAEGLYWLGIPEFDPRGQPVINLLKDICSKSGVKCTDLLTSFTGQNCCLNDSIVNTFLDHEPQATATKNMIHLAQMMRQGTIKMYDYNDKNKNMEHYGQPTPPAYNMTTIPNDLPIFLSYGGADALSDVNDVKLLLDSLKHHDSDKLVIQYREDYAHADYVMAANAKQDLRHGDDMREAREHKLQGFFIDYDICSSTQKNPAMADDFYIFLGNLAKILPFEKKMNIDSPLYVYIWPASEMILGCKISSHRMIKHLFMITAQTDLLLPFGFQVKLLASNRPVQRQGRRVTPIKAAAATGPHQHFLQPSATATDEPLH